VLVCGASYLSGSILAAALFVVLDVALGTGASTLVIGILALFVSRIPGGLVGFALSLRHRNVRVPGLDQITTSPRGQTAGSATAEATDLVPSEFAVAVLQGSRR